MAGFRHVLWDMGGTLMDTYPSIDALLFARSLAALDSGARPQHTADEDIARTAALLPPQPTLTHISRLTRGGITRAIAVLAARYGLDATEAARAHEAMKQSWMESAVPPVMPGAAQALAAVSAGGGLNCIVTHRDRASATLLLKRSGLAIDALICQPDGYPRKPDPTMYEAMLAQCGLEARECVAVGDRAIDALAALRAGVTPALLATGFAGDDPLLAHTDREAWDAIAGNAISLTNLGEVAQLLA